MNCKVDIYKYLNLNEPPKKNSRGQYRCSFDDTGQSAEEVLEEIIFRIEFR